MTLRLAPTASAELRDLVNQLNQRDALALNPTSPARLFRAATVADLPTNLGAKVRAEAFCDDVGGGTPCHVCWDGTNWRRTDTNATL